ncbi:AAA family ATPase [Synoicihabitans lomoniglobus]|uniref:MoxR family ATPase n=1 Tax=Synoicihabitans lomoniglobus TaxID=2909285 RepID=A0AAF0I5H6_9BACT|nr:MoxR family ATPase [Opitutaceae bacterium LMO-M01]WED67050.1 MoxR family ATPase [Opitutaceae bacterium LMO-M01]
MSFPENAPPPLPDEPLDDESAFAALQAGRDRVRRELDKVIVGQADVIEQLMVALLAGGHCLLTGAPGLAKTLLVKSVSQAFDLSFQRIQFTPDLMPADITGTEILTDSTEGRRLAFVPGPVFTNILLADEINRTPPKTQAALLEAMQEHQVTAAGVRHTLSEPFFVLATQNPVEMEGTYPLPEAQLDRFLFNVLIDYLPEADEIEVVSRTTSGKPAAVEPVFSAAEAVAFQSLARNIPIASDNIRYAVQLATASRPKREGAPEFVNQWINWGAGTRAGQALVIGAKARALWQGRTHATADDIRALAAPVLRHRLLLNYRAEADGVTVEDVIAKLITHVKAP